MSDTIAAIATPLGEGGVSLVRISGKDSLTIASSLFHPAQRGSLTECKPHRVYFGEIRDPESGDCVDEVLLTFFKAPKSYTAEDVVEINGHGGVYVTSRILQLTLDCGARLAEPGEFTRRAFMNGRIDLSQAEAVADLIAASSDRALTTALSQLKGQLSGRLNYLYERLLAVQAHLEAAIDFPDEGLKIQKTEETLGQLRGVRAELESLIESYRRGKIFREGVKVALVGKPNVGKSSLLNALLKEDRAIVTPHPGTTRDTLEETVRVRDIHIHIIDSAGLRENPEAIEEEGIQRTRRALGEADLALAIFDRSQPLDANDELLLGEVNEKPKLILLNKCDLEARLDVEALRLRFSTAPCISVSAKTLSGLEALYDAIHAFAVQEQQAGEAVVVTRERHRELLVRASQAVGKCCESLEQSLSEEFVAVDIQVAMESLGGILGKTVAEDLLDQIFASFCIGK